MCAMAYSVPDLPYPYEALEPHISADTMRFHHDKHHQAYVDKANAALDGTGLEDASPREMLHAAGRASARQARRRDEQRRRALQPHALLGVDDARRRRRSPRATASSPAAIRETFGSFAGCKETIKEAALSQFGSGWAWLVSDGYRVLIVTTSNQDSPISDGLEPLLGIDVWEHAYYLDYENRRADYIDAWLNVVNWDVVEQRYAAAPVPDVADILLRLVTVCSVERRFGEVTMDEARQHSTELKALAGWGPMAKVGAIARGWSDLAVNMQKRNAATVAELDPGIVEKAAIELWIVPPDRSMV